jgi:hypothetical protein
VPALPTSHVVRTCDISQAGDFVRALVGPGTDEAIQDCYRSIAVLCIQSGVRKALVIAEDGDPFAHNALVTGLQCAALAGLPQDFMLALVARTQRVFEVFANGEQEAAKAGITARVFSDEAAAIAWLMG